MKQAFYELIKDFIINNYPIIFLILLITFLILNHILNKPRK